jgi:hypothetical protein
MGASVQPFPDERGEALTAVDVPEPLELDEVVWPVVLDDAGQVPSTRTSKASSTSPRCIRESQLLTWYRSGRATSTSSPSPVVEALRHARPVRA